MLKNRLFEWRLPLVIFLVFTLHFAVGQFLTVRNPEFFLQNDGQEYFELGKNLGEKGRFVIEKRRYYEPRRSRVIPEMYRIQIFSVLHGALTAAGIPAMTAAALLLALATAGSSCLMFLLAQRIADSEAAGWIALALFQFHPLLALYSVQFGSEALFTCSVLLFFYCLTRFNNWKCAVYSGLAGVFSALVRPTAFVFLPAGICLFIFLAWLSAYREKRPFLTWHNFRPAVLFGFVFVLCSVPLLLRNHAVSGNWNLAGYLGGYNLYIGNNRENMKAYRSFDGHEFLRHQTAGWDAACAISDHFPEDMPPAEADRQFVRLALEELRGMTHGERFALFAGKAWHYLRPYPMPGIHGSLRFWGMTLCDTLLWGFGIAGFILVRKRGYRFVWAALMILCSGLLAHTLVHVYMRHRVPFMTPIMILFASVALVQLFQSFTAGKKHPQILHANPD